VTGINPFGPNYTQLIVAQKLLYNQYAAAPHVVLGTLVVNLFPATSCQILACRADHWMTACVNFPQQIAAKRFAANDARRPNSNADLTMVGGHLA
jgi:hypothetical protein